jgi:hexokinase
MDLKTYLVQLRRDLVLPEETLRQIASSFGKAMSSGLGGKSSSLKMLPSFIGLPTGKESGRVLAIDFGGTNVRVIEAELDGAGKISVLQMKRVPLIDAAAGYNYCNQEADAGQLFGFIASRMAEIVRPGQAYPLGHTFSFPCSQTGLNEATLLHWTKEFRTRGVEGQDIGALLNAALVKAGLSRVKEVAIINDTVGTQLCAAYAHKNIDLACICGTGHNTCYLEPRHPLTGAPMIVNMESGNFDGVVQTSFDLSVDRESGRTGEQRLEKMVSGYYLGEVVRHVLADMAEKKLIPSSVRLAQKQVLKGMDLDRILSDSGELLQVARIASEILELKPALDLAQRKALQEAMQLVARRSARLVAATFEGTVLQIDAGLKRPHVVAIDGSLYEKMPGYAGWIQEALDEMHPAAKGRVTTMLAKDGSGIGAAIAAATAASKAGSF